MKIITTLLLVLLTMLGAFAQCAVGLRASMHVCTTLENGFPDTPLATDMEVTGGVEPLTYEWNMEPIEWISGYTFWASDYLDDTTAADPTMFEIFEDSLTFFLKVTDADEQTCHDTITVTASLFGTHLGSASFTIAAGDSVQLWQSNVVSNYPTDSILWQPTTGLSDPNAFQPWASPVTDQQYHVIIWDSEGCMQEGAPFLFVSVEPVGIENINSATTAVYSTKEEVVINDAAEGILQLWESSGRMVLEKRISGGVTRIGTEAMPQGVYLYVLLPDSGEPKSGKLIVH